MRYAAVILGLLVVVGVAGAFQGDPETGLGLPSNPYYLFCIPEEYVPTMDGDLSDWAFMPKKWVYTFENVPRKSSAIAEGKISKDDFDVIIYGPAWCAATNTLMFAVHKVDDISYHPFTTAEDLGPSFKEDNQQWCTDPDGSGGLYRGAEAGGDSRNAQQNCYNPKWNRVFLFGDQKLWWEFEEPYTYWGSTVDKATGSYDMEVSQTLWDWLEETPEQSTKHIFEPGQIIGLTFLVVDRDSEEDAVGVAWHYADPWKDASTFTAFYVMSEEESRAEMAKPAVEPSTWGTIKAAFK